jgi:hypothetical protein
VAPLPEIVEQQTRASVPLVVAPSQDGAIPAMQDRYFEPVAVARVALRRMLCDQRAERRLSLVGMETLADAAKIRLRSMLRSVNSGPPAPQGSGPSEARRASSLREDNP